MKIDKALIRSYPFTIRPLTEPDGGGFAIEYADLPGCISDGDTLEEALRNGSDAVKAYLSSCSAHGDPLPKPGDASGQWRQRVRRSSQGLSSTGVPTKASRARSVPMSVILNWAFPAPVPLKVRAGPSI